MFRGSLEAILGKGYESLMQHASLVLPGFLELSKKYRGRIYSNSRLLSAIENIESFEELAVESAKQHLKTGHPEESPQVKNALDLAKRLEEMNESIKDSIMEALKNEIEHENIPYPKEYSSLQSYIGWLFSITWSDVTGITPLETENEGRLSLVGVTSQKEDMKKK